MPLYEKLLFFPGHDFSQDFDDFEMRQIAEKFQTVRRMVSFSAADGSLLSGWYFPRPGAHKVVLVSHGNAGNISNRLILANALLACGASVFLYDYRGYGRSQGKPSLSGISEDGLSAFDYLVDVEKVAPSDIVVYGESIGTGVACRLSAKRPVGGIILQSGFPSLLYAAHDRLWFTWLYPEQWFANLDSLSALRAKHAPLLLIHGGKDMIFPARYAAVIEANAAEPKELLVIKNMGHTLDDPGDKLFLEAVTKFISGLPTPTNFGVAK